MGLLIHYSSEITSVASCGNSATRLGDLPRSEVRSASVSSVGSGVDSCDLWYLHRSMLSQRSQLRKEQSVPDEDELSDESCLLPRRFDFLCFFRPSGE